MGVGGNEKYIRINTKVHSSSKLGDVEQSVARRTTQLLRSSLLFVDVRNDREGARARARACPKQLHPERNTCSECCSVKCCRNFSFPLAI